MNREQARLELDATTLRPHDAVPEARAHVENDTTLAAWVNQRTAFDKHVSGILRDELSAPRDLRERLLASAKAPQAASRRMRDWIVPSLVAAAACIALGWQIMLPEFKGLPAWQAEAMPTLAKLEIGMTRLDQRSTDVEVLKRYLTASSLPYPDCMPEALVNMRTFGCKRIQVAGRPAAIICFDLGGGKEAHLIVLERAGLPEAPPEHQTQFTRSEDWNLAAWSDGTQSFLLATKADLSALKKLLGQA